MKKNFKGFGLFAVVFVALALAGLVYFIAGNNADRVKYSEIIGYFENDQVLSYSFDTNNNRLEITLRDVNEKGENIKVAPYTVPIASLFLDKVDDIIIANNLANANNPDYKEISYDWKQPNNFPSIFEIIPYVLMIALFFGLTWFMMNRLGNSAGSSMNFGKAKFKNANDEKRKTMFDDVAGADEEKEELKELVDFLKSPKKYADLGAKIPKGVLLVGPPGTGKTLLARAVAGESGVPFYLISGSDFVEMFVGVGASRVRDLFDKAKKTAPSIVFIDEIDAVGRHRGAGLGGGHDERAQTLNQLLVEMDGFGANEGVIVIAATNRPDVLDPALLRPGRFDRQVTVGRPDAKGREEILKVHSRNKPLGEDISLDKIAKLTVGFTGADLENLLNEAALLAARRNKRVINQPELQEAMMKVMVGPEKKSKKVTARENRLTAYHEAGHAILGHFLETSDPIHEVSIIARGMAGGYTFHLPQEDVYYSTRTEMYEDICVLLGGRIAEALVLGDISTGASSDLQRATQTAHDMITKYGMSDALGSRTFGSGQEEVFLGRSFAQERNYSEAVAAKIDEEVSALINKAYKQAENMLNEHMTELHAVANALLIREKISGDEFRAIISGKSLEDAVIGEEKAEENN